MSPQRSATRTKTARPRAAVFALVVGGLACTEPKVIGEGQFSRPIAIASDPASPLPRLAWRPGEACPGPVGGCTSFCEGPPSSCPPDACLPLLIDSGSPLSVLPSGGSLSFGKECLEVRAAAGLLDAPSDPDVLAGTTASFRFREAPILRGPDDEVDGWAWEAGDERNPIGVGGVIGGNILRDFAFELRHLDGEPPSLAVFSNYPGNEPVLADQGRAYVRLSFPGRLLGRLISDRCSIGPGLDCELSRLALDQDNQELLFESTRALVDACVAPPPCALEWDGATRCRLRTGGAESAACAGELGRGATLLVATGVPGLVLFDDSATRLLGDLDALPPCDSPDLGADDRACRETDVGRLVLAGWPALDGLVRLRVRALGLVEGLDQPTGSNPCERLRARLEGVERQCRGFLAEGRPVRPSAGTGEAMTSSVVVVGEVALGEDRLSPDATAWLDTLILPATAPAVIALRREIVPEGAQPDGIIGGALLRNTETVLDFTESVESPGVRVRCLDPGDSCVAIPGCTAEAGTVEFENADAGRTSCCFGLPRDLISTVVLGGLGKEAPRIEDACCSALPRAAITDLQSTPLQLCTDVDLP